MPLRMVGRKFDRTGEGVVAHEVDQCVYDVAIVKYAGEQLVPVDLVLGSPVLGLHALYCFRLLTFGQEFGLARRIGKEEKHDRCEQDGRCTLDDEKQPPWSD